MTFEKYFKFSSYMLVLCGFGSLFATGFYSIPFSLFFVAIVLASWLKEKVPYRRNLPKTVWNTVTLGYFAYVVFEVFLGSKDLIGEGINFTVYLQIHRLLNANENKDYFLMYLLSFIHLVGASVLTDSIAFSVPFFLYIILATWCFTLYNIKTQSEESLGKGDDAKAVFLKSKSIITRRFLFATSLLSAVIIVSTMTIFFSFPRMSLGYLYKKVSKRRSLAGFSEQIDLGSIGSIIQNSQVVMRIETPGRKISEEWLGGVYWRGTAFDTYDGRKWSQSNKSRRGKVIDSLTGVVRLADQRIGPDVFIQRIFLEPLDTRIIFAADQVRMFKWEKLKFEKYFARQIGVETDYYDANYLFNDLAADQSYLAYSDMNSKLQYKPFSEKPDYPKDVAYLELPYRDERTEKLAREITSGAESDYDKAAKIKAYLENNYYYSDRDLNIPGKKPIEEFLFRLRRGHCEFFSSAMAILLRYVGIPSRNVVGFRGGAVNEVGNYVVVRQNDAHSWVEAYIYGNGWMRFDPTPGEAGGSKLLARKLGFLGRYLDYAKLRWNKYIIDYDLRSQAKFARFFWAGARKFLVAPVTEDRQRLGTRLREYGSKIKMPWILLPALLFLLFSLLALRTGKKSRGPLRKLKKHEPPGFYKRMLKILEKKGMKREAYETPLEFGKDVLKQKGNGFLAVLGITENYYDTRFGAKKISQAEKQRIDDELRKLRQLR